MGAFARYGVLCLLGCLDANAGNPDCPRGWLNDRERAQLEAEATRQAGTAPIPDRLIVCVYPGSGPHTIWAWLETPREAQPDGTSRWSRIYCTARKSRRGDWDCRVEHLHGFHLMPYADVAGIWAVILESWHKEERLSVEVGRRLVSQALDTMAGHGSIRPCVDDHPIEFEAFRAALAQGDGLVSFIAYRNTLSLMHDGITFQFDIDKGWASAPRPRCWFEEEIVVTSAVDRNIPMTTGGVDWPAPGEGAEQE